MTEEIIVFKGSKEGLCLSINKENDLTVIKEKVQEKISSAGSFFQGIKSIHIKGTSLSKEDFDNLKVWFKEKYKIEIEQKEENPLEVHGKNSEDTNDKLLEEGLTKFVYTTLRSGRKIEYNGNIVIIGDVNPGAEIVATGNIVVMGILRGIAHAGALGNVDASVVAFSLQPTQLRIADIITRSPDKQSFKPTGPEKACIRENSIIILPYHKNL